MPRCDNLRLTARDLEILEILSLRVRMASLEQIGRTWWHDAEDPMNAARLRLRQLHGHGQLLSGRAIVVDLPPLTEPVAVWRPRQLAPELGHVAWLLRKRWPAASRATTVFAAPRSVANRFGGRRRGRIPHPFQVSHDLGVTEMFLAIRALRPHETKLWIDEDRLAPHRRRQKLPDAVLAVQAGSQPVLVLEFGGLYGKHRLRSFHIDAVNRGLAYEIW